MAKVDSSKLLPSIKPSIKTSSAMVLYKKPSLASKIKPIQIKTGSAIVKRDDKKESKEVNNKLVQIEKFFKSELLVSNKAAETKREDKERNDFQKAEDKLETPKTGGFRLPSISASLPNLGFLDRIKRFIFFTALGWLLPKLLEFLPKLEGIGKIIGNVYTFAENMFGKLFDGFMSLVKFGGELKTKTLGFIGGLEHIPGLPGDFQKAFEKLGKDFDTYINVSIIAGALLMDLGPTLFDEIKKLRGGPKPESKKGPSGRTAGATAISATDISVTRGKVGEFGATRATTVAEAQQKLRVGQQLTASEFGLLGINPGSAEAKNINRSAKEVASSIAKQERLAEAARLRSTPTPGAAKPPNWIQKLLGRLNKGSNLKFLRPIGMFFNRIIPFVGGYMSGQEADYLTKQGDSTGAAIARFASIMSYVAGGAGVIMGIATAVAAGGLAASFFTVGGSLAVSAVATQIAAVMGAIVTVAEIASIIASVILLTRDILLMLPPPLNYKLFSHGGMIVGGYQGGGNVTRGGRDTNAPITRSITPQTSRILPIQRPPKPPASKPGKDVGGVKKLNRLYPDPESSRSTLYEVLSSGEERQINLTEIANPYKALTSSAKIAKTIPLIGGVMGAAIDLSLGEKPSRNVLKSLTMGMGSVIDSFIDQKANTTIALLSREIMKFSDGGLVKFEGLKKIYNSMRSGELLYKILGPILSQKSNEIIQLIKREIDKRFSVNTGSPGSSDALGSPGQSGPGGTTGGVGIDVDPNEIIGRVGSTGISRGAHIHLEDDDTPGTAIPDFIKQNILVSGKSILSSGVRTSAAGWRIHPVFGDWRYHSGEDWDNGWNDQPISLTGGLKFVKYIPENTAARYRGYGNVVVIEDPSGNRYFIGHLNSGPQNLQALTQRQQQVQQQQTQQQQSSQTPGSVNTSTLTPNGRTIMGEASYYADAFQGNPTSTGETFDYNKLTAAMSRPGWNPNPGGPYWAEVTNLANGKKVRVKVNDSGPFEPNSLTPHRTRVIDLSKAAFAKIASVSAGIINVKVERLSGTPTIVPNPTTPPGSPSSGSGTGSGTGTSPGPSPTNRPGYPSAPQLPPPPGPLGIIVKSTKLPNGSVITIRKNQTDGRLNYTLDGQPLTAKQIEDLRKKYPAAFTPPAPPDAVSDLFGGLLGALERPAGQTQAPRSSPKTEVYRALSQKDWIDFTNKGKKYRFKVIMSGNNYEFKLEEKVIDMNLFGANIEKYDPRSITPDLKSAIEAQIKQMYKFKSGGLIQPTKSRLPIPNSYASYESPSGYSGEPTIAIQPIFITKQMPASSNSKENLIIFPVPVEVNTNMDTAYNRSRGY